MVFADCPIVDKTGSMIVKMKNDSKFVSIIDAFLLSIEVYWALVL